MRTRFAILCIAALLVLAASMAPAAAGGYYSNGYDSPDVYYGPPANVWYSSSCCYRRVVRHVSVVGYVPAEPYGDDYYYGSGYGYGGRSYVGYYGQPYYGYYGDGYYVGRGYGGGYYGGGYYGGGYGAYNAVAGGNRKLRPRPTGR